jgi:hypothetical protein
MKSNAYLCDSGTTRSGRRFAGRMLLHYVVIALATGVSTGCADDVVMTNPRTGMTEICQESLRGFNPWSQTMACAANHEAQGWIRVSQP